MRGAPVYKLPQRVPHPLSELILHFFGQNLLEDHKDTEGGEEDGRM